MSGREKDAKPTTSWVTPPPADIIRGSTARFSEILARVVSATGPQESEPEDVRQLRDQLRQMADELGSQPLTVDPVLTSLVATITGPLKYLTPQQKTQLTSAVAQTMFENADSRVLLEKLWHQLQGDA